MQPTWLKGCGLNMSTSKENKQVKVKIKSWMGVAVWKWVTNDTDCGICRLPFDGCCPDCRFPGDDCPLGIV